MKITVLDGHALNLGDLSWDWLEKYGDATVYDRTPASLTVERALGADAVITNKVAITKEVIDSLPGLKYIGVLATGYNLIDVEEASRRGITVSNIPSYSTMSVAQQTFALILALTNRVEHYAGLNRDGKWAQTIDFCYWDTPLTEINGKTFGIYGLGNIGMAVAGIAHAFGMNVIATTSKSASALPGWIGRRDKEALFRESDVVSLHCPLTEETEGMVDKQLLSLMKPTSLLINTSRGQLINERDLADALGNGVIAGAGLDVLAKEPPEADNPLLKAANCVVTPHIAWATRESRSRLMEICESNLKAFCEGSPQNVVG